jgi:hypothetical protein
MSSKNKRVTYKHPIDENADYLVPLQYEYNSSIPIQSKVSENSPSPPPLLPSSFFGSTYLPISLLLYVGIPISQLVIGLIYIGQCPVQDLIVVWMVVSGIFGILLVVSGVIIHIKIPKQPLLSPDDGSQSYPLIIRILIPSFIVIFLFIVAWFFAGQVFVFGVKLRVELFDPTLPEYCHGTLYKSAYIIIFVDYLIFLFGIILNILTCVAPPDDNVTTNHHHQNKHPVHNMKT